MKIIMRSLALAVLMLATVTMIAQKGDKGELKKKFQAINNQMVGAVLNQDMGKILTYYDEKVISMPNYSPMLRGIDALKAQQEASAEKGVKVTAMKLTTKKVTDYGDIVVEIGNFTITVEAPAFPTPMSDEGKYLTVWRKNGDKYKILNEIWNSDVNPMAGVKKGNEKPKPVNDDKGSKLEQDDGQTKSGKK